MAKHKPQSESSVTPPAAAEGEATPTPAVPVAVPDRRVYRVNIPNCLVGERHVLAASADEALAKYKAVCGIRAHDQPAKITVTDLKAEDVELFGES